MQNFTEPLFTDPYFTFLRESRVYPVRPALICSVNCGTGPDSESGPRLDSRQLAGQFTVSGAFNQLDSQALTESPD
jgi:hypothetical protein